MDTAALPAGSSTRWPSGWALHCEVHVVDAGGLPRTEVGKAQRLLRWSSRSGAGTRPVVGRRVSDQRSRRWAWTRYWGAGPGRIGIMGGTFDPIHHGHLVAASEVADRFVLDEVVFVPTGEPWQKGDRPSAPAEDRYLMTVIATASNPRFAVSRVDIDRGGPTYTVDTLRDLRDAVRRRGAELFFITGADALEQILSWKDADQIFELAHFVGVTRPGFALSDDAPARRHGEPGRGAGDGDLVHRVPGPGRRRAPDLVPGAGRCRAVHRQAAPVPKSGHTGTGDAE